VIDMPAKGSISTYSITVPRSTPIEDVRLHVRMGEKREARYGLDFPHRKLGGKASGDCVHGRGRAST